MTAAAIASIRAISDQVRGFVVHCADEFFAGKLEIFLCLRLQPLTFLIAVATLEVAATAAPLSESCTAWDACSIETTY